jgi:L-threonine kinase
MIFNTSTITATVPGTCGELVQGWSAEWDEAVLVSCPIARYSQASVELCAGPEIVSFGDPTYTAKSRQAARLLLNYLNRPDLGAKIRVSSQLRPSRGMASSTADIVAVMAALAAALDYPLSSGEAARLACRIEPSDSTMFAGLTALAYRDRGHYQELGPVRPLPLLMLDTGCPVDTLSYNAQLNLTAVRSLAPTTQTALELIRQGIDRQDVEAIGAAATLSALSYQAINYNPFLAQARRWANATGALGLVRAHSGSVTGLLYEDNDRLGQAERWLTTRFDGQIVQTRMVSAGWTVNVQTASYLLEVSPAL